jgi:hypothetical protein
LAGTVFSLSTKPRELEQRTAPRQALSVPVRIITTGRHPETIDGVTLDISMKGLGVKFGRGKMAGLDALLETLVEDRLPVQIMLRLPQGSVTVEAQVVWWGLLGDDEKFALRAGVLLRQEWSDTDWKLIEDNLKSES